MKDKYQIDFEKYSLQKFFNNLKTRDMIPSRKILKDDLDKRFKIIKANGITNLRELAAALKTKQKIELFSDVSGLGKEYLTLLNREAKSYHPNPIRLDKFSEINPKDLESLSAVGIKNSRHMIIQAGTKEQRIQLSKKTKIPLERLDEIVCLSDLARAYGVGPVFAHMIYNLGIQSIKEFIEITADEFIRIYEEKTKKKADFGINEIQFSLELAKDLEQIIEV